MQEVHSWSKLSHCPISISAAYSKTAQDQTINKAIEHLRSAGRIKSPWISVVFSLFSFSSNYQETVEILRLYSLPASYIAVFRFFITIDNLLWEGNYTEMRKKYSTKAGSPSADVYKYSVFGKRYTIAYEDCCSCWKDNWTSESNHQALHFQKLNPALILAHFVKKSPASRTQFCCDLIVVMTLLL